MTQRRVSAARKCFRCFAFLALFAIISPSVGCKKSERAAAGPKMFASQEDASKAVHDAAKAGDSNTLLLIFGPDAKDLIFSGDPVQDKIALGKFTTDYDQMHRWRKLKDGAVVLNIGAENYPFPFPLLKSSAGQWSFDSNSAKEEILARRIGDNELGAIDVLNAMADAQSEYFSQTHDGSKVQQYAQKFISDDGKQNGLYWETAQDQPESPLGPLAAFASSEGYTNKTKTSQPFHGYLYRILTKQGDQVQEGARDYIIEGNMTGGFAILAYPAEYSVSGVMSFLINQEGTVFEKDFGDKTAILAKDITEFNPDGTWAPVGSLTQN
jgi:biotin carboxyl carrier protein